MDSSVWNFGLLVTGLKMSKNAPPKFTSSLPVLLVWNIGLFKSNVVIEIGLMEMMINNNW